MLAQVEGVDRGRSVAAIARDAARRATGGRVARDGRRCRRRLARASPQRGGSHRPVAGRPSPHRKQAPCDRRPTRNPSGGVSDRRKPSRHHTVDTARRRDPVNSRSPWAAAEPAPQVVRRPRLRLRQVPQPPPQERDHTDDRPARAAHGSGLGKVRWVVERIFAWLHQFKRLRTRSEVQADLHQGLLELACSIICLRRLRTSF